MSLEKQINYLIAHKDADSIAKVSANEQTYNFLMSLPDNTKCENTSDFQGGSEYIGVYYTMLNSNKVPVILRKSKATNLYYKLFPQYKIISIGDMNPSITISNFDSISK